MDKVPHQLIWAGKYHVNDNGYNGYKPNPRLETVNPISRLDFDGNLDRLSLPAIGTFWKRFTQRGIPQMIHHLVAKPCHLPY